MEPLVAQESPLDHGREQMKILAGLEVTTKSAERNAEAIGEEITQRDSQETQPAVPLDVPVVVGQPIPIRYVQMDGAGVSLVKKEN
jgi:hypothetical protein